MSLLNNNIKTKNSYIHEITKDHTITNNLEPRVVFYTNYLLLILIFDLTLILFKIIQVEI